MDYIWMKRSTRSKTLINFGFLWPLYLLLMRAACQPSKCRSLVKAFACMQWKVLMYPVTLEVRGSYPCPGTICINWGNGENWSMGFLTLVSLRSEPEQNPGLMQKSQYVNCHLNSSIKTTNFNLKVFNICLLFLNRKTCYLNNKKWNLLRGFACDKQFKGRPISFASLAEMRLKENFLKSAKILESWEEWRKNFFPQLGKKT